MVDCGLAVHSLFSAMRASLSLSVLRLAGFFFSWILGNHISSIVIPRGQLEMLKQVANVSAQSSQSKLALQLLLFSYCVFETFCVQDKVPIVFVPLHRSHLDYIVLHYVLLRTGLQVPYVAAGDNLNIPIIGWFLRRLGAFFIRRKTGPHDTLYRALLNCVSQSPQFLLLLG